MTKEINKNLNNLWQSVSENEINTDKIKYKRIETDTYTVIKQPQVLNILEKFDMVPYYASNPGIGLEVIIPFDNMPSWGLCGVEIVPLFYSLSRIIDPVIYGNPPMYPLLQGSNRLNFQISPMWQYLGNRYILKIYIIGIFLNASSEFKYSLYLDLDIVIQNQRKYFIQQGYKS